jgi:DNA recombination protein RmuC
MSPDMPVVLVLLSLAALVLLVALLLRRGPGAALQSLTVGQERAERLVREEAARSREELARAVESFGRQLDGRLVQLEGRVRELRGETAQNLDKIRATVDEKLQQTLETRLGESFKLVSERLEQVHRGLGEMQTLATGVGDLKRVLTNVKSRGTWGEVQLGALLEQVLAPEQYAANVAPGPRSSERVEYAVKMPGRDSGGEPVWLPIDAKFPVEDYQRLCEAAERGDPAALEETSKALEARVRLEARKIRDKYVKPPHTTDFAILFLPTEGLFAEVLRRSGLTDEIQREQRVVVAGPTTLWALLVSLQVGFRTLAIEKRSGEVFRLLGAVKTEFERFGGMLEKVRGKLDDAGKALDGVSTRTRQLERRLREVEALPGEEASLLLPAGPDDEAP